MTYAIEKGGTKTLYLQVVNSSGGIIDVTSSTITFTVTDATDSTVYQLTTADATEIKITKGTSGLIQVYNTATETVLLTERLYSYDLVVDGTSRQSGKIVVQSSTAYSTNYRRSGTTAQRPSLPSGGFIGFEYFDTDITSPIWWSGTAWDITWS